MSTQAPRFSVSAFAMAVVMFALELGVLVLGWRSERLLLLVGGHAVVVAGLAAWAYQPAVRGSQYGLLLWIATAAFGPLGPGGVLLAMTMEWYYRRKATGIEAWHAMLFPPSHIDEQAELWRRIGQRASDLPNAQQQVTPFLDVLTFGSVPQRQSVIAIIVQQFHPAFAPALKAALRDDHNVIRVGAATAIARLENEFLEKTMSLEAAAREQPDDADAMLALARHYDDQAFTGLLDTTREQDCRVRATDGYERYLATHPDDTAIRFRLARLYQRRRLWSEAEKLFRRLADEGYPGAHHWLMESLFVQGRFADLRAVASRFDDDAVGQIDPAAPEIADTIALWAGQGAIA